MANRKRLHRGTPQPGSPRAAAAKGCALRSRSRSDQAMEIETSDRSDFGTMTHQMEVAPRVRRGKSPFKGPFQEV